MKILEVSWRNFNSYGNQIQRIEFGRDQGDLYLLLGGNGNGKCLNPETELEVFIKDEETRKKFMSFLESRSLPKPLSPDI